MPDHDPEWNRIILGVGSLSIGTENRPKIRLAGQVKSDQVSFVTFRIHSSMPEFISDNRSQLVLVRLGRAWNHIEFVSREKRITCWSCPRFAIVPLIFTLSEDALQAVPQHLRAASMSCGATVWQTTIRVVIPTALSGLFSAIMLGLGRAIGETMVVLMVSGNSPIMELNPFSGFRTLSRNSCDGASRSGSR